MSKDSEMNQLSLEKRTQIINLLVEGNSLRSCSRLADVSITTVCKLFVEVGTACQKFHDDMVVDISAKRIECDEIWAFVYAKQKNAEHTGNSDAGDAWTWTAIDPDTKLILSWLVGKRDAESANTFMHDVASRLNSQVQMTTDGLKKYVAAVEKAFEGHIDYAQLVKIYGKGERDGKIDNRIQYIGADRITISGNPDPAHISTSMVERQNLTMRMHMRRFTRKTNAFSKKLENHKHSVAIHFVWYNFVRIHKTLRVTPAMEAGLTDRLMEISDMVKLTEKYGKDSN
jgi:IS1 family transposase